MDTNSFDPSRYLTKVGNNDYLEVKWRLVWLRTAHPDAQIETEIDRCIPPGVDPETGQRIGWASFKARVSIPNGGSATGWGCEGIEDFRDFFEKAETKALGRALAALGYGTQFSGGEMETGPNGLSDAPVDFASTRGRRMDDGGGGQQQQAQPQQRQNNYQNQPPNNYQQNNQQRGNQQQGGQRQIANPSAPASPRQFEYLTDLLNSNGYDPNQFDFDGFTKGEANSWIDSLKSTGRVPQANDPKA